GSAGGRAKFSSTLSASRKAEAISMTMNWLFGGYGSGSRVATSVMASSSLIRCLLPSSAAFALNQLTSSRNRSTLFGSPVTYCCHTAFSASSRERAWLGELRRDLVERVERLAHVLRAGGRAAQPGQQPALETRALRLQMRRQLVLCQRPGAGMRRRRRGQIGEEQLLFGAVGLALQ